jgi:hypothetical protein
MQPTVTALVAVALMVAVVATAAVAVMAQRRRLRWKKPSAGHRLPPLPLQPA